jgi:hypothetical protein
MQKNELVKYLEIEKDRQLIENEARIKIDSIQLYLVKSFH